MADLISREELAQAIDNGFVVVVDALGPDAFEQSHLPNAINIPDTQVAELAPSLLPDKDAALVVYCANIQCQASATAQRELAKLGYTNVRKYAEGRDDWEAAGLRLESGVAA